jgi:hypothetical protein
MSFRTVIFAGYIGLAAVCAAQAQATGQALAQVQAPQVRTTYRVKQVAKGAVYLDGGSNEGLAEGMRLKVTRRAEGEPQSAAKEIGDIAVVAVATISALCEVKTGDIPIEAGDIAELSPEDMISLQQAQSSKTARHVAQTVSFSEGDPLDTELRQYVPKRPSPEVNSIRGRISFEQSTILDHTTGLRTLQEGIVLRADMHRIDGSYWNFTGYYRGALDKQSGAQTFTTLDTLLNRTYQLGFYYNNPNSRSVAGFGRFLLPWAPSLSTIDGGYFGRRLGRRLTAGVFAGSTPNPTSWNYEPGQQVAGSFLAFEYGDFKSWRYRSTAGAAVNRSHLHPERQFLFFENSLSFGMKVSLYHDLEVDRLAPALTSDGRSPVRVARSFLTLRFQLTKALALDLSHNYFRDVPTFDTRLLVTGFLDQFLFQGYSAGLRYTVNTHAIVYGSLGSGKNQSDPKAALNYTGGVTLDRLPVPVRVDLRYSRFNSSFGSGDYKSIVVSRQVTERLRFDIEGGVQGLNSALVSRASTKYGTANLDYLIGRHYILGSGWTLYRGGGQSYDQSFFNFGYRF